LLGWIMFIALVFGVGAVELIIEHQLLRPFNMPTRSMETTIMPGDHLFARTCAYWFVRHSHLKDLDYSVVQQCMHSGLCLPTCPTYDATKLERNSPRGRIALVRAI